jgi:hypothetical protein
MKNIQAEGATPMNDNYKLLVNNVFTMHELGLIASALASSLNSLLNIQKTGKMKLDGQIQCTSTSLGKIMLAMPEEFRNGLLKAFKDEIGLEFKLEEKQADKTEMH